MLPEVLTTYGCCSMHCCQMGMCLQMCIAKVRTTVWTFADVVITIFVPGADHDGIPAGQRADLPVLLGVLRHHGPDRGNRMGRVSRRFQPCIAGQGARLCFDVLPILLFCMSGRRERYCMGAHVEGTHNCKAVRVSHNMCLSSGSVQVWQDGVRPVPEALWAAAHREGGLPFQQWV